MEWRRPTRNVTTSNQERNSFRLNSGSSSYDPPSTATRTYATRSRSHANRDSSTGLRNASDGTDYFFQQTNRARQLAAAAAGAAKRRHQPQSDPNPRNGLNSGTRTDSVVSGRQNFLNSADGAAHRSFSSTGTQRRDSVELVNEQPPRRPRSEQRRLVRNGFISPVNIERNRSSVSAAVRAEPDQAPAVQCGGANLVPLQAGNGNCRSSSSELVNGQHRTLAASSASRSSMAQLPQQSQIENRKRKHPSSSSSRSIRGRTSRPTPRNSQQVESDERLARQLQQELYNEVHGTVDVTGSDAAFARQNHTGAAAAAAARTNSILRIQEIRRDFDENDYEMLLALDENNHEHCGASESEISNLPQSIISSTDGDDSMEDACAICCDAPAAGDVIRHLPCSHRFHKDCIDLWLQRKPSCPICKSDIRWSV